MLIGSIIAVGVLRQQQQKYFACGVALSRDRRDAFIPVRYDGVIKMETFSALLALCAGNSPVTGEFPTQGPVIADWNVDKIGRLGYGFDLMKYIRTNVGKRKP